MNQIITDSSEWSTGWDKKKKRKKEKRGEGEKGGERRGKERRRTSPLPLSQKWLKTNSLIEPRISGGLEGVNPLGLNL